MDTAALGYTLKPLLLTLLLPPVPMMLLTGLGALLLRRRPRAGAAAVLLGLSSLWLSSCEGTSQWLIRHLLDAPPGLSAQAVGTLREQHKQAGNVAVLVLGAGIRDYAPEYLGSGLNETSLERLRYGIWLARWLQAPLGFSGGIGWSAKHKRATEASVAARVARQEFGLPLTWAEDQARDTRENASLSVPLLKAAGVRTIVLVTHVQHMPRAFANFREAAQDDKSLQIVPAPVGLVYDGMSQASDWSPSADGFAGVRYAVYEWLGSLAGH